MYMRESPRCSTDCPTPGDAQICRRSPMDTTASTPHSATCTSVCCGGTIVRCNVRAARATTLDSGAPTNTALGAHTTDAMGASGLATTSLIPCCIGDSDHCHTGFSPPFCCVSPVRPGASPESWASIAGRTLAGADGDGMRPCPMQWSVNGKGPSKPMPPITPRGTKGKPSRVGRRC